LSVFEEKDAFSLLKRRRGNPRRLHLSARWNKKMLHHTIKPEKRKLSLPFKRKNSRHLSQRGISG